MPNCTYPVQHFWESKIVKQAYASVHQVCLSRTNQHWLTMHLMTTTWSIGRPPLFWTENPTKVLDGSKKHCSTHSERRTAIIEPGRGELHTEPHVRPISCHVASLSWQETEEELNKLLLMKVSDRDRNVKVKNVGCVEVGLIVFLQ